MHKHQHQNIHLNRPIHVAILTVSDTRDYDSDKGGQLIQSLINQHENHVDINHYRIVKDDIEAITHQLKLLVNFVKSTRCHYYNGRNRYLTKRCDNRSCSPIVN